MILLNFIHAFESENSIHDTSNVHDVHENVHENVLDVHDNVHENSTHDIIPTIIDTIRFNFKITLEEMTGLKGEFKRTIQRIVKNSDQIERISPDKGGNWEISDKASR